MFSLLLVTLALCGHPKKQYAKLSKIDRYKLEAKMQAKNPMKSSNRSLKKGNVTPTGLSKSIYQKHLLKNLVKGGKTQKT